MGKFATLFESTEYAATLQSVKEDNDLTSEGQDRSEGSANHHLASHAGVGSAQGGSGKHYIYVRNRGAKKHIAGPFNSKEEAEAHPARKWADGVHSE